MSDKSTQILAAMKAAGKPVRPGDVATATGIDKAEVSKLIQGLKKEGKVHSPKRCFWAPSD